MKVKRLSELGLCLYVCVCVKSYRLPSMFWLRLRQGRTWLYEEAQKEEKVWCAGWMSRHPKSTKWKSNLIVHDWVESMGSCLICVTGTFAFDDTVTRQQTERDKESGLKGSKMSNSLLHPRYSCLKGSQVTDYQKMSHFKVNFIVFIDLNCLCHVWQANPSAINL